MTMTESECFDTRTELKAMRAAVAAEREACAQLVDVKQGVEAWEIHGGQETIDVLRDLAAAIRARSNAQISGGTPSTGADCCATKGDGHEM